VTAVAPLPQLEQRAREQRQRSRLALAVGEQAVGEPRLEPQPGSRRGQLDRPAQLVVAHGADKDVVCPEEMGELRMCGAAAVEVGTHGEHDNGARVSHRMHQRRDELGPLVVVPAGGEQLLELVDDEHQAGSPPPGHTTEFAHRVLARPHERARPAFAAGQDPAGQRGQQTGPDHR
jgi:hypothetical protein